MVDILNKTVEVAGRIQKFSVKFYFGNTEINYSCFLTTFKQVVA